MGRWLRGPDQAEDRSRLLDPLVTGLIESLHHPRFLILGEPDDASALQGRWDLMETATSEAFSEAEKQETIPQLK